MAPAILAQLATYGPHHCDAVTVDDALAYTRALARSHGENFTVVSFLLPRGLRGDFANVYAFCRWADDLGDETGDPRRSLELLAWWRRELDACYAGGPRHPVFVALRETIRKHDLPREPFDRLIDAFEQDQRVTRYRTWDELLDYCARSANPVGRIVLQLFGCRDAERQRLSDATCTALQLTNFWQDVRRDILGRGRVYLPDEAAARHGLDLATLVKVVRHDATLGPDCAVGCRAGHRPSVGITALLPAYRATLHELVGRTWPLFREGRRLWPLLPPRQRAPMKLFTWGGESVLRAIERRRYDTLTARPALSKFTKAALMLRAAVGTLFAGR